MSDHDPLVIRKAALQVLITAALDAYRTDLRAQIEALFADPHERTVASRNGYIRGFNQAITEVKALIDETAGGSS